jgi:hypothetical protein
MSGDAETRYHEALVMMQRKLQAPDIAEQLKGPGVGRNKNIKGRIAMATPPQVRSLVVKYVRFGMGATVPTHGKDDIIGYLGSYATC